ncbi:PREDICTED: uncharacterized protein LOC103339501 [Prunus mume]|uniref:Uncharacterized protein LOC103339501 n=1 Tax=Prunus mume TaxID=102107 RepID=A0ABM1LVU9_PRUMU|nr:PREDICTED: uncharacterized protein LOC103339501 [Prunus mume]
MEQENQNLYAATIETIDHDSKNMILIAEPAHKLNLEQNQLELGAQIKHFSHDQHFLSLTDHHEAVKDISDRITTCHCCIRPITVADAFYSCTEQQSCHFFLHKTCAQLPTQRLHPFHPHPLKLLSRAPKVCSTGGVFECDFCRSFSQGFLYSCERCDFYLDLQCSFLSDSFTHQPHEHPLVVNTANIMRRNSNSKHLIPKKPPPGILKYLHKQLKPPSSSKDFCRGCGFSSPLAAYFSCMKCNFHICIPCIKLPPTASHRYENHPLKLTYRSVQSSLGDHYCAICEGKRDPSHLFYYCEECDFDCHPHCILGRYSQVKLGSTYKHSAHPHILTLVDTCHSF